MAYIRMVKTIRVVAEGATEEKAKAAIEAVCQDIQSNLQYGIDEAEELVGSKYWVQDYVVPGATGAEGDSTFEQYEPEEPLDGAFVAEDLKRIAAAADEAPTVFYRKVAEVAGILPPTGA